MRPLLKRFGSRQRGAALIIVLAFVVIFAGVGVAYLSRTTGDRQVAHSSFHQSNVDQLVQSAVDNIIGDLRQEITNGSTAVTQADGTTVYTPTAAANMVPQRSGNAAGAPNLVRRSIANDQIPSPGRPSRASQVNSTTQASANGRSVTLARWNTHYLLPKANTSNDDSYPASPLLPPFNPYTPDPNGFIPPDWVFVTDAGATVVTSPSNAVVGRYSYAVYAEGGLLDMNVAGYPTDLSTAPLPAQRVGRKGSIAYADLTALGGYPILNPDTTTNPSAYDIDRTVGWRNYATTQPNNNFPATGPPASAAFAYNFHDLTANPTPAALFSSYVLNNTSGFLSPNTASWNNRTDQVFIQRQQLIGFRKTIGRSTSFSANALQYLSTFSRETNAPSFSPPFNASEIGGNDQGGLYAYRTNATSSTAVNPNFLSRRVTTGFTRFDGTTAAVGEPLVKTRFPLRRLAWITYNGPSASRTLPPQSPTLPPTNANYDMWALQWVYGIPASYLKAGTATNVQACFGLTFGGTTGAPWTYSHGATNRILRLDEVAAAGREPDFFELLQAGILSGSLGQNTALPPGTSGGGVTGGNVWDVSYMSSTTQHILSIGAAIIDQADADSIPTRIQFIGGNGNTWTAYGVENLPYITQLYPIAGTSPNPPTTNWATYLLFELWNPHQNIPATYPVPVRLRVDGAIGLFTGGNGQTWSGTPQIYDGSASGKSVTLNSTVSFSTPAALTATNTTNAAAAPGPAAGGAFAVLPTIPP
jgi:hypothetical protein